MPAALYTLHSCCNKACFQASPAVARTAGSKQQAAGKQQGCGASCRQQASSKGVEYKVCGTRDEPSKTAVNQPLQCSSWEQQLTEAGPEPESHHNSCLLLSIPCTPAAIKPAPKPLLLWPEQQAAAKQASSRGVGQAAGSRQAAEV